MAWWPDNLTDLIIIVSGIATAVLVYVIWRQFSITKREMESRLRPWVTIDLDGPKWIRFESRGIVDYLEFVDDPQKHLKFKPISISFDIKITNSGRIPAQTHGKLLQDHNKINKKDLENLDEVTPAIVMPGQTEYSTVALSYKELLIDDKIFYVGVVVEYEVNSKTSVIGRIWKVGSSKITVVDEWMKDPDIKA